MVNVRSEEFAKVYLILVVTICSALLPLALHSLDRELITRLIADQTLATNSTQLNQFSVPLSSLACAVCCLLALVVSYSVRMPYCAIALAQIVLVSCAVELTLITQNIAQVGPISSLCAILAGIGVGAQLRQQMKLTVELQSKECDLTSRRKEAVDAQLQLIRQDEVERRLLAGDLHDQILNDLKSIRKEMRDQFTSSGHEKDFAPLDSQIGASMQAIRQVMDNLSPVEIEHLGFCQALESCLEKGAVKAGFKVRFRAPADEQLVNKLSRFDQLLLYRLVQESVNNICKHSGATIVEGEVCEEAGTIVIRITDDGKGIDSESLKGESRGMRYMRQRAGLIGAAVAWRAGPDEKGVTVQISISPQNQEQTEQEKVHEQ